MRFKGTEFANVFSHFAPPDWRGPRGDQSAQYYGIPEDRLTTLAEDGYRKSTDFAAVPEEGTPVRDGVCLSDGAGEG